MGAHVSEGAHVHVQHDFVPFLKVGDSFITQKTTSLPWASGMQVGDIFMVTGASDQKGEASVTDPRVDVLWKGSNSGGWYFIGIGTVQPGDLDTPLPAVCHGGIDQTGAALDQFAVLMLVGYRRETPDPTPTPLSWDLNNKRLWENLGSTDTFNLPKQGVGIGGFCVGGGGIGGLYNDQDFARCPDWIRTAEADASYCEVDQMYTSNPTNRPNLTPGKTYVNTIGVIGVRG